MEQTILAFVLFSASCTINQITTFQCEVGRIEYTNVITSRKRCEEIVVDPRTKQYMNSNFSNAWVIPSCQMYTREVAMTVLHYLKGI